MRFKELNIGSSAELDGLIELAQNVCRGVTYDALQTNGHVRDIVRDAMASITSDLDALMAARPTRMFSFDD